MKKTALIITTFLVLLGVAAVRYVHAQQILPLTVIPPKQEVLINPGEHFSTSVKFLNQGDSPISGTLSVLDFIVSDDKGTPVFLDNPQVVGTTTIPAKYSAAKWIDLPQDNMVIAPRGNGSVPIVINVPKNAAPGGRYAAILFQPSGSLTLGNPASGQETPIAIRLASLIYIRVAGPISENATVTKFQGPSFLEYGPASITTEILNRGDYHITPKGTISLKDMFGRVVGKADLDTKNIFPGTSRAYATQLGEKLMIGKFTVTLAATYGEKGQLLSSTLTMWVFPWKAALAILLAIVLIILLIVLWYKKIVKKEEKLVEELKEEKTELETLKEKFKDEIKDEITPKDNQPPPKEETP
jgi:uncharacterized membrane protein